MLGEQSLLTLPLYSLKKTHPSKLSRLPGDNAICRTGANCQLPYGRIYICCMAVFAANAVLLFWIKWHEWPN